MNMKWLQTHVISWTGFAMRLLHIHFGNLGIMPNHVQRSMSQKRLQRENITAGTQVSDGECVSEFMRIGFFNFCSGSQPVDQDTQAVLVERPVRMADEEGGVRIIPIFSAGKITPNRFSSDLAQENGTTFAAFCPTSDPVTNGDLPSLEVNIVDGQRTQFSRPQPSIHQHQNNCLVAVGTRSAHHKLLPIFSLRLARIDTCLKDFFYFLFCECFNGVFLKFWGGDFLSGIWKFKLNLQPSEKGSKCYPDISDGFGGEWFRASVPTFWFVFGSQPGHVTGQVGCFNFRNFPISNVLQPMTHGELIGGNCALA